MDMSLIYYNTLYCNNLNITNHIFEKDIVAKFQECNNFSYKEVDNLCKDKIFLTYDDRGLSVNLRDWLSINFPNKSKYEL
jgi:hypothetical protein